jgi:branched-chain amino acid transport system substrate-binding protein
MSLLRYDETSMHQTTTIRVHTTVLLIVLLLAVAGAAFVLLSLPQPPREVIIGAVFPLSGQDAATGRDIQVALELAAEIVNNEYDLDIPLARTTALPALDGAEVRIHFADSNGSPETGYAEAERLITEEQVVALTGAWHSAVTGSASTAAEERGIPFICGSSTEPALTERGYTRFFRTTPNDLAFSEALLRFAQDLNNTYDIGMRTIVIVSIDNEWGRSAVAAEQRFIAETGFELLDIIAYDPAVTNVSGLALRVARHDPDILIQNSYTADAIRFMQAYKRLNWCPALFLAQDAGFETTEFLQTMSRDADFIVSRSAWAGLDNPNTLVRTVNELYRARHPEGANMGGQTAREFTAFLVLADAINRAGSTDPEKIRTALAETNWPAEYLVTGWDGVAFDEHGQNSKATPALLQRQEEQWRAVWPDEIALHRALVPAPNWDERGVSTSVQQPAPSETTILVINSYGPEMAWEQDIQRGIIEGLARSGYGEGHHTYALQTYCMDTKVNYTTPEQIEARAEAAFKLIAELQPDLVFVNDDNALKYVAVEYTKRYPERELPFVFSGVNLDPTIYEPIASLDRPGGPITGALERVPYNEAFTLAQRIFPNVSTIVILADASPSTDLVVSTFRERYPASAAESPLTVIGLLQVTSFADWKARITDYQTEADVIGVLNYYQLRDETGTVVPAKEVANWTIHHNNLPEIGFVATDPGDGFLAAVSASYYKTGIYVGLIGGEILSGADPAEIPIVDPHVVDITFNLERAEMLGITIPRAELAEATTVYHAIG